MSHPKLQSGNYYHIYNRGINSCNLFGEEANYHYFLLLYEKYINPIAETFAWVLMPNHFHLIIYIKDLSDTKEPHHYFSNLFNAYTKAFNKRYHRHGALFERPFRRKQIDSDDYLKQVIIYTHNNPIHHAFTSHPLQYQWSSYSTCISSKPTNLKRSEVISLFDDLENFKFAHANNNDQSISSWLGV
jgi:REP element-mobilizing transposase RayT